MRGAHTLTAIIAELRANPKEFTAEYIAELLETPNNMGQTAMHLAIIQGEVSTVRSLLHNGFKPESITNNAYNQTALHSLAGARCSDEAHDKLCGIFLGRPEISAHLNDTDTQGKTALHLAAGLGHLAASIPSTSRLRRY